MKLFQWIAGAGFALALTGCAAVTNTSPGPVPTPTPAAGTVTQGRALGYKSIDTSGHAYYVFLNADTVTKTFTADTDLSSAQVLVDQTTAGTDPIAQPVGVSISGRVVTLAPGTSAVVKN